MSFLQRALLAAVFGPLVACTAPSEASRTDPVESEVRSGRTAAEPGGRDHTLRGEASWYGSDFHGQKTACGEAYDMYAFTAAHKSLPFHTVVRVVHPKTKKSVVVRINDRGPYADGRIIDLSWAAARDLEMLERGTMPVVLRVLRWGDGSRVHDEG